LPGLNLFDYYRETIKNIIANPVGVLFSTLYYTSRYYVQVTEPKDSSLVGVAAVYVAATDVVGSFKSLQNMFENTFSNNDDSDYCEKIPEIKSKLEEVLNNY
jgi:hypothetical protein